MKKVSHIIIIGRCMKKYIPSTIITPVSLVNMWTDDHHIKMVVVLKFVAHFGLHSLGKDRNMHQLQCRSFGDHAQHGECGERQN